MSLALLEQYYDAFNRGDAASMVALVDDDIRHEPSQGEPRLGKQAFAEFLAHMNRCYLEQVADPTFMISSDGARGAAEFMLTGIYLESDTGLPPANRQQYRLRVGAFFDFYGGRIVRVSNHYNLADWVAQVS